MHRYCFPYEVFLCCRLDRCPWQFVLRAITAPKIHSPAPIPLPPPKKIPHLRTVLLQIDFLQFQPRLRLSQAEGKTFVFDPVRRKDLVLTPEELLRQLVLLYLLEHKKYPANRIRVEVGFTINGLRRRSDIVVYDAEVKPWLLVECKSPKVRLTQATFEQAARYNLEMRAPYLVVTNGPATYCCELDFEEQRFHYLQELPDLLKA
ncbi:MAG: type I restriction enzyme HsdR N-terminal domain-containing protein [Lewinellaceae bacterium]|nr:type I restriction enzyme HsdR N-terminal domain-containing protein [Lewinellaceae bacterium]